MAKRNTFNSDMLAREFLDAQFKADGGGESEYTLRSWHGGFYEYKEGHYVVVSKEEIKAILSRYLVQRNSKHEEQVNITETLCNNIMLAIRGMAGVLVPESTNADTWVDGIRKEDIQTLAFNNGLLVIYRDSVRTDFIEHTPDYFTLTKLPYDYDPQTKCPKFLRFLDEVMEQDPELIELLQQWAGYVLTNDLRQHKFLLCVGEGANGKSVFLEVIQRMIGRSNCSSVLLSTLGETFSLCPMYGKKLNVSSESGKSIESDAETILKALTSGDPVNYNCKYKNQFSAIPTAKVMIATNEVPRFQDKSGGIWRRILIVPFERIFPEQEQNKNLANELAEELPGIFNWALDGMRNLTAAGSFIEPAKSKKLLADYRRDVNPARTFLEENYQANALEPVPTGQLYSDYKKWCEHNGYSPMNESNFGKEVKRVFPKVEKVRLTADGKRGFVYQGIAPKSDISTDTEEIDFEEALT